MRSPSRGSAAAGRWPRLTAHTASAATTTTATVQIRYGTQDRLPVKVVPVSPWRNRRKADRQDDQADRARATEPATPNRM